MLTMSCVSRKIAFQVHIIWQQKESLAVLASHNESIQLRTSEILDACSYRNTLWSCVVSIFRAH